MLFVLVRGRSHSKPKSKGPIGQTLQGWSVRTPPDESGLFKGNSQDPWVAQALIPLLGLWDYGESGGRIRFEQLSSPPLTQNPPKNHPCPFSLSSHGTYLKGRPFRKALFGYWAWVPLSRFCCFVVLFPSKRGPKQGPKAPLSGVPWKMCV